MKFSITVSFFLGLLFSSCEKSKPEVPKSVSSRLQNQLFEGHARTLNEQLPIRLDSASTLYSIKYDSSKDGKVRMLIYYVKINTQMFKATGNFLGQHIPDTLTMKQFIYEQTLNQVRADPSYSDLKTKYGYTTLGYRYYNEAGQKLFSFVINL